mmetsp:Transcript_5875/g.18017  ORF Transcript_5875/g.18017 Transcript_5875/m.18017 type:complete len:342 (+) Transcript_5875:2326-3351(+)
MIATASPLTVTHRDPSRVSTASDIHALWPLSTDRHSPVSRSHTRAVRSSEHVTACVPLASTVTLLRRPAWPLSTCMHRPRTPSHTRAVRSCDAVTSSDVEPINSTDTTHPVWPSSTCMQTSSSRSQTHTVASSLTVAARQPSAEMATSSTRPSWSPPWPSRICSHEPSASAHTRTVPSSDAVTQRRPWRSITTALTRAAWPLSTWRTWPLSRSQMQQLPSRLATAASCPSGATATSVSGLSRASCITKSPTFMSHTCAVPSSETVMTSRPLGLITTRRTGPLCPRSVMRCSPPACSSVADRGIRCTTLMPARVCKPSRGDFLGRGGRPSIPAFPRARAWLP